MDENLVSKYTANLANDIRDVCAGPRAAEFMKIYKDKVLALDHHAPENRKFLLALYTSEHPAKFILEWHDAAAVGRQ